MPEHVLDIIPVDLGKGVVLSFLGDGSSGSPPERELLRA